ncbi:hypothetical protein OG242_04585 [Streptomyces sp. NBC_00727]|uniref:hypothetical protein n=1 Tax=Streptomyces sp. NBC_00727 TaxID=2903675 RepID=UPI003868653A
MVSAASPTTESPARGKNGGTSGPGGLPPFWKRHRVPLSACLLALPAYVLWAALLATGGGDLAAQVSWTRFVAEHPGSPYSLGWYGGVHVGNYSVLAPQLMALFGVRTVTVASGMAASWLVGRVFVRSGVRHPMWPTLLAVLFLWANVASGRSTFALGVALALASCLMVMGDGRRLVAAGVFSTLATMASPVAGLFLLVCGAGRLLDRDVGKALVLCAPPAAVVGLTTLLFPFSGVMPMSTSDLWKPLLFSVLLAALAPPEWRVLRRGAGVYALGVVLSASLPTPVGSNVVRLAEVFGGPVLLAAVLAGKGRLPQRAALAVAAVISVQWVTTHTLHVTRMSTPVPAWAAETHGVRAALDRLGADRARVEVVPAVDHRETTALGPRVNLARGWNRQVDVERGDLFYEGRFSAAKYRSWLDRWAVKYVVLPNGEPDFAAKDEAGLVRSEPGWLKPVWHDSGWRIYAVEDARPMATGAGASVVAGDHAKVTLRTRRAGTVNLRIAYSPWLRTDAGCIERDGEWVRLRVPGAGRYEIDSSYLGPWQRHC